MIRIKTNIIPSSRSSLTELFNKIKELDQDKEYKVFVSDQKKESWQAVKNMADRDDFKER